MIELRQLARQSAGINEDESDPIRFDNVKRAHPDRVKSPPGGFHGGDTFHNPSLACVSRGAFGGPGFLLPFARGTETLGEPDAFPIELMNRAVMGQSVQQGRGQGGIAEHAGPLRKRQVRRHDEGTLFVSIREDLKQQLGALGRERDIADLISTRKAGRADSEPVSQDPSI